MERHWKYELFKIFKLVNTFSGHILRHTLSEEIHVRHVSLLKTLLILANQQREIEMKQYVKQIEVLDVCPIKICS